MAAGALEFGLGAVVAGDAGSATTLAWYGALGALAVLAIGVLTGWPEPVQCSMALVGLLLLLRHHDRLVLAPVYGACLLFVGELAGRSAELRGQGCIGPGVVASRLAATATVAAAGGCAAAIAAIGVSGGPARSVAVNAAGVSCLVAAVAAIVALARRQPGGGRRGGGGDDDSISRIDPPASSRLE